MSRDQGVERIRGDQDLAPVTFLCVPRPETGTQGAAMEDFVFLS